MRVKKYFQIIKGTWAEYMEYRLNFVLWRVRIVMQFLVTYFLWWAIFTNRESLAGYTQNTMLTYIFLTLVIRTVTLSSTVFELGNLIHTGNLSNLLIKPIKTFGSVIARDLADKGINIFFLVGEFSFLFILLQPPFTLHLTAGSIFVFSLMLILGAILYILMSILISFLGFWAADVWAPRFLFFVLLEFFTGMLFPLDIFPKALSDIMQQLPFAYFIYFPIKVILGGWNMVEMSKTLLVGLGWIIALWLAVRWVWMRGLRVYTSVGK